ncbi:hypothetical protein CANARDRAFT_7807 [[Candida] arabinofermentans NRRL YB-2248]|uniref:2-dehydropantoate 2-reductase n=1 Tax=[Candida] arabinofermentans NRRL YB-2248 TaxID=983967 RepID=A0A1E4T094_9ASCO|nr:hypothetical protein CANARDRAFT_7807 [[Candida] arabinofermentans NRRL YB-2248]
MTGLRNVYVLGAGGIGTLVSSHLTKNFSLKFILRSQEKINLLQKSGNNIQIKQLFNGDKLLNYKVSGSYRADNIPDDLIDFLIVSVKTFDTLKSLQPLMAKIGQSTKILLIQNGMGVVEELYNHLWPEIEKRPTIYQGVISHGVYQDQAEVNTFNYNHAGLGDMKICKIPKSIQSAKPYKLVEDQTDGVVDDSIIKALVDSEALKCEYYCYKDLTVFQIEKLMVNSCINPVTAILNCVNGELAGIQPNRELFQQIIDEGVDVMVEAYPIVLESKHFSKIDKARLLDFVIEIGTITNKKNSSSMRQDVLNLRPIEIDYINGYIAKLGDLNSRDAKYNKAIAMLVKSRLQIDLNRSTGDPLSFPSKVPN